MSKKILAVLAVLFICVAVFATSAVSSSEEEKGSNWSIYGGTSYLVSHIGASYDIGRLELSGTLYSGFPNIAIINYVGDMKDYNSKTEEEKATTDKPKFIDYIGPAFKLALLGNVSAMYDLTSDDKFDVLVGTSISGAYSNLEEISAKLHIGVVALDAVAKVQFNFAKHSGIYIATELPLAGVLFVPETNEEGVKKTNVSFFTIGMDGYLVAALNLLAYTTRVGYVYSF